MSHYPWRRTLVGSVALATAGIMACIAALSDVLMPKGSLLAFVAAIIPVGLAIVGLLVGFIWVCDKCDDYFNKRKEKLLGVEKPQPGAGTTANNQPLRREFGRRGTAFESPRQTPSSDRYLMALRGLPQPNPTGVGKPRVSKWHGQ